MATKWLTYHQRIDADLTDAFKQAGAKELFNADYIRRLSEPVKQLDDWLIKLGITQFAILAFLMIEFVSPETTFSLFGLSMKAAPGLKEVLLAFVSTLAIAISAITGSRDTSVNIIQGVTKRTSDEQFQRFAAYASPIGFNLRLYLPLEYRRGQFSKLPTKLVSLILGALAFSVFLSTLFVSAAVQWMIIKDIWLNPTLGGWSYFAVTYVATAYLLCLLTMIKRLVPLPYNDHSERRASNSPWQAY